jgi:hypothetical protein
MASLKKPPLIRSLGQYLEVIDSLLAHWTPVDSAWFPVLWFRGHRMAKWDLRPSWYRHRRPVSGRKDPFFTESGLLSEFKMRAPSFLNRVGAPIPQTDWEWLFLMQHYGLPTRLLDWTESSLIGLYFALREKPEATDSAVWVLNPLWLNLCVLSEDAIPTADDDRLHGYVVFKEGGGPPLVHPIAMKPVRANPRIAAQSGVFTIHGTDRRAFDRISCETSHRGPQIEKLTISKDSAIRMLENLDTAGITESTVFPELEALGREFRTRFSGHS